MRVVPRRLSGSLSSHEFFVEAPEDPAVAHCCGSFKALHGSDAACAVECDEFDVGAEGAAEFLTGYGSFLPDFDVWGDEARCSDGEGEDCGDAPGDPAAEDREHEIDGGEEK